MSWQDDLRDWGLQRSASPPSPAEVEAFVRRARQHRRQASVRRVGLSVGLAMAALAVFWLMLPLESPPGWTWTPTVPVPVASLPPLSPGTHRIADDQLIVADDSAVLALSTGPTTRLQLDRGQVDAQVAPRAAGESFTITTGDYAVRVIGTRFTVQHSPFEVRVREGVVSVERPADDRRWQVGAGEWFADGQLHRRVKQRPPPSPPLADLQQLVLDGRFDEARPLLERRLTDDPADVSSWRLLARLETRAGRTDAAVDALLHIVAHAPPADAQSARYEAARLLESRPRRVVELLTPFLRTPHPLAGEARLRLADAHIELGEHDRAEAILNETVDLYDGTAVGAEAQRRLLR